MGGGDSMNKMQMLQELEHILMLDQGTLKEDSCLRDYSDWDSLAFLQLMAIFDSKLNIAITDEEISSINTVADVFKLAKID